MNNIKKIIFLEKNISLFSIYKQNKYFIFFYNLTNTNLNLSHKEVTSLFLDTNLNHKFVSGTVLNSLFGNSQYVKFLKTKYLVLFTNDLDSLFNFLKKETYLKLNLGIFSFLFDNLFFINSSFFVNNKLSSLYLLRKENYVKIISILFNIQFLVVIMNYISYILQLIQLAVNLKNIK